MTEVLEFIKIVFILGIVANILIYNPMFKANREELVEIYYDLKGIYKSSDFWDEKALAIIFCNGNSTTVSNFSVTKQYKKTERTAVAMIRGIIVPFEDVMDYARITAVCE